VARSLLVPGLLLAFVGIYKLDSKYYIALTLEDGVVEWATFGLLLLSGVLALVLAARLYRARERFVLFFALFGVFCVFLALEEISWVQRIFHIKSPQFFLENSSQREINVHNVIQKRLGVKTKHIAGLSLFVYGVCLPLLVTNRKAKRLLAKCALVVPPPTLLLGFLLGAIMMIDWPTGEEEELGELFFSVCFFLFILGEFLTRRRGILSVVASQHQQKTPRCAPNE
jgi:hypothetical protein